MKLLCLQFSCSNESVPICCKRLVKLRTDRPLYRTHIFWYEQPPERQVTKKFSQIRSLEEFAPAYSWKRAARDYSNFYVSVLCYFSVHKLKFCSWYVAGPSARNGGPAAGCRPVPYITAQVACILFALVLATMQRRPACVCYCKMHPYILFQHITD
jgi:hypothetical protein